MSIRVRYRIPTWRDRKELDQEHEQSKGCGPSERLGVATRRLPSGAGAGVLDGARQVLTLELGES
jgi:hypothetical protein